MPPQKRKRATASKTPTIKPEAAEDPVKEEWVELPHNMGKVRASSQIQPEVTSTDDTFIPLPKKTRMTRSMTARTENSDDAKLEFKMAKSSSTPPSESQKSRFNVQEKGKGLLGEQDSKKRTSRGRAKKLEAEAPSEKMELDKKADMDPVAAELKEETASKKRQSGTRIQKVVTSPDVVSKVEEIVESVDKTAKKKPKKTKDNPYGLTPGYSPFSDWPAPTADQCQEVTSLLASIHPLSSQPPRPPAPSTTTAGCGEVPAVLDAMIRTLLSAATSGRNSSSAFQGLLNKFGTQEDGTGKGSVNWGKVREAPLSDVFEAIKSGGLAKVKSAKIKQILDLVFDQNTARRQAKIKELEIARDSGAKEDVLEEREKEIERLDQDMLSLDHFHELESEEAMVQLTRFPNIGVKTASCILLFCLRRPSFAVDTHVWRMSKWLGWVPPKATRDETFSHLEVRCPDDLKYPLHQLLISHGKNCGRCRANTGLGSQDYINANCPIEHLVTRTGKRKGGEVLGGERKKGGGKKKKGKGKGKMGDDGSEEEAGEDSSDWNSAEASGDE